MQIWQYFFLFIGAVIQSCSVKKVFLEISQNSLENTYARVFFNKVAGMRQLYIHIYIYIYIYEECFSRKILLNTQQYLND